MAAKLLHLLSLILLSEEYNSLCNFLQPPAMYSLRSIYSSFSRTLNLNPKAEEFTPTLSDKKNIRKLIYSNCDAGRKTLIHVYSDLSHDPHYITMKLFREREKHFQIYGA